MSKLKKCPFCGGDQYSHEDWCFILMCLVNEEQATFGNKRLFTEEDLTNAWNRRDSFEVPDGYTVLPATKLDKPKPVIFDTNNGIEVRYDFSETIKQYSEYLADKSDYEILTKSLNRAGWFKERTCENKMKDEDEYSFECSECLWDNLATEDMPASEILFCPNCGAKVVE